MLKENKQVQISMAKDTDEKFNEYKKKLDMKEQANRELLDENLKVKGEMYFLKQELKEAKRKNTIDSWTIVNMRKQLLWIERGLDPAEEGGSGST